MIKTSWRALFMLLGALAGPAGAMTADAPYPQGSGSGRIEQMDLAASTMVVDGIRYDLAADVRVEIGGSHGAFTLLQPGMRIRYDYLKVSASQRYMILIQELPANVTLDET